MEQYISKAAVMEEIKRRITTYKNVSGSDRRTDALISFKNFLDTLEVKEVDLDKEIDSTYRNYVAFGRQEIATVAKHFFELGLKAAQKGK